LNKSGLCPYKQIGAMPLQRNRRYAAQILTAMDHSTNKSGLCPYKEIAAMRLIVRHRFRDAFFEGRSSDFFVARNEKPGNPEPHSGDFFVARNETPGNPEPHSGDFFVGA
jgi:hypothetical protein